jgi:very-short-patch-repair endonuclease
VSHRSAAWLYGMHVKWNPRVDVTLPGRRRAPQGMNTFIDHLPVPAATFDRIRVPRPEIVLLQLCALLDADRAGTVMDKAVHDGVVRLDRLVRTLDCYSSSGRRGIKAFRRLIEERCGLGATDSWAEDYFTRLVRKHKIELLHHHVARDGEFVAELDFVHLPTKLNIEIDGSLVHNNPIQNERDKTRDIELSLRGWTVLRFTYRDLIERPDWVIASIRRAIEARTPLLFH